MHTLPVAPRPFTPHMRPQTRVWPYVRRTHTHTTSPASALRAYPALSVTAPPTSHLRQPHAHPGRIATQSLSARGCTLQHDASGPHSQGGCTHSREGKGPVVQLHSIARARRRRNHSAFGRCDGHSRTRHGAGEPVTHLLPPRPPGAPATHKPSRRLLRRRNHHTAALSTAALSTAALAAAALAEGAPRHSRPMGARQHHSPSLPSETDDRYAMLSLSDDMTNACA